MNDGLFFDNEKLKYTDAREKMQRTWPQITQSTKTVAKCIFLNFKFHFFMFCRVNERALAPSIRSLLLIFFILNTSSKPTINTLANLAVSYFVFNQVLGEQHLCSVMNKIQTCVDCYDMD